MAVIIRMQRRGKHKRIYFRICAFDERNRREGVPLEQLGWYHPLEREGSQYKIDIERVKHWVSQGASVSDTVNTLMKREGLRVGKPTTARKEKLRLKRKERRKKMKAANKGKAKAAAKPARKKAKKAAPKAAAAKAEAPKE